MFIALNLLIYLLILGVVTEKCLTPNNESGECIPLYMCPQLDKALQANRRGHIEFAQNSVCGGNRGNPFDPYVCCGTADNYTQVEGLANRFTLGGNNKQNVKKTPTIFHYDWLILDTGTIEPCVSTLYVWGSHYSYYIPRLKDDEGIVTAKRSPSEVYSELPVSGYLDDKNKDKCITPDGVEGTCTHLHMCPPLLRAFANPLKGLKDNFAKYRCPNDDTVCCEPGWSSSRPLSDRTFCGRQQIDDYRVSADQSKTTNYDEFPWLAAIIVPKLDNRIVCQGVLISERYVLTANQCFSGADYEPEDVTSVRLGGYDLKNTTYCVELSQYNTTDCAIAEEFGVEKLIPHEFYYGRVGLNDIALIKLDKNVTFTAFIRPICLPIQGTKFAKTGDTMYVTGWGKTSEVGERARVKKKILTTLIDSLDCEERLKTTPVRITPLKMCTIDSPLNKEFTCDGDAGGPVMFVHKYQWHIEGITSKGWPCGRGYPEVKTRVSQYLAWIALNMEQ